MIAQTLAEKPTGAPRKEEDPEGGEGDFPENCLFRLVHNYAHRMARGRKEGEGRRRTAEGHTQARVRRQSRMQIGDSRRPERSSRRRSLGARRSGRRRRTKRWSWERAKKSYLSLFLLLSFRGFLGGLPPSLPPSHSVSVVRTHFCSYC